MPRVGTKGVAEPENGDYSQNVSANRQISFGTVPAAFSTLLLPSPPAKEGIRSFDSHFLDCFHTAHPI